MLNSDIFKGGMTLKSKFGETQLPISATSVVLFLKHHHNSLVPSKTSKLLLNAVVVRNPNPKPNDTECASVVK